MNLPNQHETHVADAIDLRIVAQRVVDADGRRTDEERRLLALAEDHIRSLGRTAAAMEVALGLIRHGGASERALRQWPSARCILRDLRAAAHEATRQLLALMQSGRDQRPAA